MEDFGGLSGSGYELVDQLVTHFVCLNDGGSISSKRVVNERLSQVISITMQVAVSRRVKGTKLDLTTRRQLNR